MRNCARVRWSWKSALNARVQKHSQKTCSTMRHNCACPRVHALNVHIAAAFVDSEEGRTGYRNSRPSLLLAAMLLPPRMLALATSITAAGCNTRPLACVWYWRRTYKRSHPRLPEHFCLLRFQAYHRLCQHGSVFHDASSPSLQKANMRPISSSASHRR
jgi:hypothetical protein